MWLQLQALNIECYHEIGLWLALAAIKTGFQAMFIALIIQ
jgi:hypothetical protein